jgi:hypothetical protein
MISIPTLPPVRLDTMLYVGRAAFLVFSFALAAVAFVRLRRGADRDARHIADQFARVLARLDALVARIDAGDPKLAALAEQIETHFKSTAAAAPQNYAIAIRLARSGARPADLVESCGLSRQEAELVVRLHGRGAPEDGRKERDARHVAPMRA